MKQIFTILTLLCISILLQGQTKNPVYLQYIEHYRDLAVDQQRKHKIPAAITLAQGILESAAGQGELARMANNHFGIKCTSDWMGKTYSYDDDKKNECFRRYAEASDSYEDHSLFLHRKRYESLFALPLGDYKAWAYGLKSCGYATDPKYAEKLIRLIETYELQTITMDSTLQKAGFVSEKDTIWNQKTSHSIAHLEEDSTGNTAYQVEDIQVGQTYRTGYRNGVKYITAAPIETFTSLAHYLNMSEKTLRKYNDALDTRELKPGDIVYVYPKKNRAAKKYGYHYFRPGETAWDIAQKYGIKLKSLYKLNGIPYGTPLKTQQRLLLR
jgi:LysM repeat protein